MKRVLLLATTTGYQIRSFGDAARALDAQLVVASDRCDRMDDPWADQAIPVRFHEPGLSVAAVRSAFGATPPDAVIAVGDRPTTLAAHLAHIFDLPGNSVASTETSRNKLAARTAFRAAGLPTPAFLAARMSDDVTALAARVGYPAVLKPLALSGSRGVMRVDTPEAFTQAFERLGRILRAADVLFERNPAHEHVLVESFIPGREYAIEGVLTEGQWRLLAIFDKPDPLDGPFFEETIYVTPSRADAALQRDIGDAVNRAARALGLSHGPVHAECRVNDCGVHVLEVAARPIGGLCSRVLRFRGSDRSSASLEEVLLRHALGEPIDAYTREPDAAGVMMIPIPRRGIFRRVHGIHDARAVAGIDDVQMTAKEGALLLPLPEGRSYLGFIFSHGRHARDAERALRDAHSRLRVEVEREVMVNVGD